MTDLRKKFEVYGSYYELTTPMGTLACRNCLEIIRKPISRSNNKNISTRLTDPDSIVIMMNPGSSKPSKQDYKCSNISFEDDNIAQAIQAVELVKARPDKAQYQIMRLMETQDWNHVRILNLSDFRQPKSCCFVLQKDFYWRICKNDIHSIFSELRREELKKAFNKITKNTPIILAWGKEKALKSLAKQCMDALPKCRVVGVDKSDWSYMYPSPPREEMREYWLQRIIQELGK